MSPETVQSGYLMSFLHLQQRAVMKQDPVSSGPGHEEDDSGAADALMQNYRSGEKGQQPRFGTQSRKLRKAGNFLLVQVALILFYTAVFVTLWKWSHRHDGVIYSPASSAITYQAVRFNSTLIIDSVYNGPPGPETDEAWSNLVQNMNIALPKQDLDKLGASSIPIPGLDNMYFAGLSVYHELHCLKRLRQYTWKESYFPNATEEEDGLNRLHTDHCLEILRQAAMCRADVSLFTLEWSRDSARPRANFSQQHKCVNFQAVDQWAAERRVDAGKPGALVHPHFGAAFPDGKGDKLGATLDMSPTIS